jgi:hypothetical protein
MVYRRRKIVYNYFKLKILLATVILLTGCSTLEERWEEKKIEANIQSTETPLICRPANHYMCIGWAGNTG